MNRTTARRFISSYLEIPVTNFLKAIGFTPNAVTLLGLAAAGASAYLLAMGYLWIGGVVLLVAGVFDLCDGALARAMGRVSNFGALLDSVVDRVSEAVILFGLLVFFIRESNTVGMMLVYLALVGSIMVSYLRARSEGLGIECNVGIMTRPERVAILGVGVIIGHWWPLTILIILGLVATFTFFTTLQRLFHTWRSLSSGSP